MNKPLRLFFLLVVLGLLVHESAWNTRLHAQVDYGIHQMDHGTPPRVDVQLAQHLFRDLQADRLDDADTLFVNSRAATAAPLARLHDLLQAHGPPTLTGWFHERFLRTHHETVLSYQFGHGDLARQAMVKSTGTEKTGHLASITIRQNGDIEAGMHTSGKLLSVLELAIWSGAVVALLMAVFGKRKPQP